MLGESGMRRISHFRFYRMDNAQPTKSNPWKVSKPAAMPLSFKDLMRETEEKRKKEMLSGTCGDALSWE